MKKQKPNRRKSREAAFQVLYCQSFTDKETMTTVSAVESVQTIEDFRATVKALEEAQAAAESAKRALQGAIDSLSKAATPEKKKTLKPAQEGTLASRLHVGETRREAIEQLRKSARQLADTESLFSDGGFTMRLLETYDQNENRINSVLNRSLEGWSLKRLTAEDRSLLRLGITELLFLEDVPPAVVIDEYLELAKSYGDKDSTRLVNGVLDRVRKECRQ